MLDTVPSSLRDAAEMLIVSNSWDGKLLNFMFI